MTDGHMEGLTDRQKHKKWSLFVRLLMQVTEKDSAIQIKLGIG